MNNNEDSKQAVDFSKPVKTKDGRVVRILCTDGPYPGFPVMGIIAGDLHVGYWTAYGQFYSAVPGTKDTHVLVNIPPAKYSQVMVVNCYLTALGKLDFGVYETREEADFSAAPSRIACIPFEVSFTEGDGLKQ